MSPTSSPGARPVQVRPTLYHRRNIVERDLDRLNHWPELATRSDKYDEDARNYLGA